MNYSKILLRSLFLLIVLLFSINLTYAEDTFVPGDFDTIQEAVNAISRGSSSADTIVVSRGTHSENITLSSNITLRGAETARTFIEQRSTANPAITVDGISNVTIKNLTFINSSKAIVVTNSTNINIANNVFDIGNTGTGVQVIDDSTTEVINNTFFENDTAVQRISDMTNIENNIFSNNDGAVSTVGSTSNVSFNCFISNTVNGTIGSNPVIDTNAEFVDVDSKDFHLKIASPCIDEGTGTDVIDGSAADMGAWGGDLADVLPYPVQNPAVTDATAIAGVDAVDVTWSANNAYLITQTGSPGSYRLYYDSDAAGEPYDGTDGESGASPSPVNVGNVTSFRLSNLSPTSSIPSAPVLQSLEPFNQRLTVQWQAASNATSYRIQYGITDTSENEITVGNVTSYTLSGLTNDVAYRVTVTALTQPVYYFSVTAVDNTGSANESSYSSEVSVPLGTPSESAPSNELTAIPEEVIPFPILPDEGCFIATATYDHYDAKEVKILRAFRDHYLLTNDPGRAFVRMYYTHGPKFAAAINNNPSFKPYVSAALYPLVGFSYFLIETTWQTKIISLLIVMLALLLIFRIKSHAQKTPQHILSRSITSIFCLFFFFLALLVSAPLLAEDVDEEAPLWALAMKWGQFTPDIDEWDRFYGDDDTFQVNAMLSYKIRDWLEVGVDGGYAWDDGEGYLPLNNQLGGEVEYDLYPLQVFALVRFIGQKNQSVVPYIGGGFSQVYYRQSISGQGDVEGSVEGYHIRAGFQFLLDNFDQRSADRLQKGYGIDNSYIILEYQNLDAEIDSGSTNIGGDSYFLGYLMEF